MHRAIIAGMQRMASDNLARSKQYGCGAATIPHHLQIAKGSHLVFIRDLKPMPSLNLSRKSPVGEIENWKV